VSQAVFEFDVPKFRLSYPEFESPVDFPEPYLEEIWEQAICIIPSVINNGSLSGNCRYRAITLLVAHIAKQNKISRESNYEEVSGIDVSGKVGDVSNQVMPPPVNDLFLYDLASTTYGKQLYMILKSASMGGVYAGGAPEREAFRKVGGRFSW